VSLQAVTLQPPGIELECLELEGITMGERVLRAELVRAKVRAQGLSVELLADADALLWRRICALLETQCTEVHS
jgi:hypothetical protein